jgi:hypothetical protein
MNSERVSLQAWAKAVEALPAEVNYVTGRRREGQATL